MKKIIILLIILFLSACSTDTEGSLTNDKLYKITLSSEIINGNVRVDKILAKEGETVTLTVAPNSGFVFDYIKVLENTYKSNTFTMPSSDVTVYVHFILKEEDDKQEDCNHNYENGKCSICGNVAEKSYLNELFGDDIEIYTNKDRNPYGVNLNKYGSDINVYFYEPKLDSVADPYTNVNKTEFYANYKRATTYEDAYYRTKHNLMSGDITDQYYLPANGKIVEDNKAVRITTATYVLDADGTYLAYVPNVINADDYIIFYGAAYTSLNDVAAYLLAFGEAPANQIKNKNSSSTAISLWGKYGRLNNSRFSGDVSKYPHEPKLPNIESLYYSEIDFGTTGGFTLKNKNNTYYQVPYNNGYSIKRGTVRMVYVSDYDVDSIDERYVFYTYNHYNDFQEYLNYHDGWGLRFGNESAGNGYCYDTNDYYNLGCTSPTQYPMTLLKKYSEVM